MKRWHSIAIVGLLLGLTAGCSKEEAEATERGLAAAKDIKKEADGPVSWLASEVERERKENDDQLARLQKTSDEVEKLLADGKLDEAEVKVQSLHWKPITSARNETDALLVSQYDEKRKNLLAIIERRRNAR
jgi:hypothetical protein